MHIAALCTQTNLTIHLHTPLFSSHSLLPILILYCRVLACVPHSRNFQFCVILIEEGLVLLFFLLLSVYFRFAFVSFSSAMHRLWVAVHGFSHSTQMIIIKWCASFERRHRRRRRRQRLQVFPSRIHERSSDFRRLANEFARRNFEWKIRLAQINSKRICMQWNESAFGTAAIELPTKPKCIARYIAWKLFS